MDYEQALNYIHSAGRFSKSAGLSRMRRLTAALGNPQDKLRFIHLAGTNGKGSTAAILDSVLRSAGYQTGLFTSPYLEDYCERIRLGGKNIPHEALAGLTGELKQAVDAAVSDGMEAPHEFELTALLALMYYSRCGCDLVIWETGLGGRLDASNVIGPPLCAVITSLSYDHMQQLGSTLDLIAEEKCGIIKAGSAAVVSAKQSDEAMQVIQKHCQEKGVPLMPPVNLTDISVDLDGCRFTYNGLPLRLPLLGEHQLENASVALRVIEVLHNEGFKISGEAIADGLQLTRWPGRLELVSANPQIVIDSAHNRGGVEALSRCIDTLFALPRGRGAPHRASRAAGGKAGRSVLRRYRGLRYCRRGARPGAQVSAKGRNIAYMRQCICRRRGQATVNDTIN